VKNQLLLFLCLTLFSTTLLANGRNNLKLEGLTDNGMFSLLLYPKNGDALIGDHHNWIIEVKDIADKPVSNALFNVSGGMAAHGHGLPSQPIVTKYLGDGQYLIEGMLFNMSGDWSLLIVVQQGNQGDRKQFEMKLSF